MLRIGRVFEFSAGHRLPNHQGKCRNNHGHNFRLEVTVGGKVWESGEQTGMILDFKNFDNLVNRSVIDKLDHKWLNDVLPNPTAENLSEWIAIRINAALKEVGGKGRYILCGVRVWENNRSFAEIVMQ